MPSELPGASQQDAAVVDNDGHHVHGADGKAGARDSRAGMLHHTPALPQHPGQQQEMYDQHAVEQRAVRWAIP